MSYVLKKYRIPADEPVVLLTNYANEYNWFSGSDRSGKLNMFGQTDLWELNNPVIQS
ncbi:MAG: hypothetical protein WC865_14945 [Bacteroidales bacterium]